MNKLHLALDTEEFDRSVEFYRAFLDTDPVKLKPGYAKFDVDEPPLNLTLNQGKVGTPSGINHFGVQVGSTEAVKAAVTRLEQAGLVTFEEADTDCCYALQDKVWVTDPNGYRWEVFVVKVGDTRPDLESGEPAAMGSSTCC